MAIDDDDKIKELYKCSENPVYFISNYFYVKHPIKGNMPINLRDHDIDLLHHYMDNNFSVNLASRQTGTSIITLAYILWYAIFHSYSNIWKSALASRSKFKPIHIPWDSVENRDMNFKQIMIETIGKARWNNEYEGEFTSPTTDTHIDISTIDNDDNDRYIVTINTKSHPNTHQKMCESLLKELKSLYPEKQFLVTALDIDLVDL
jgi:hypothetical protein